MEDGKRYCASAIFGFGCADDYAAFRCIGDTTRNADCVVLEIYILPLNAHALAASDSGCNEQMQHTAEVQIAGGEQSEKLFCLFRCQRVNCFLDFLRCIHALHGIFDKHFLFICIAENVCQRSIVVTHRLRCKRLALRCFVFGLQVNEVLLNLNGADFLQDAALKIVCDDLCNVLVISGSCGLAVAADVQRKPDFINKGAEIVMPFLWRQVIRSAASQCFLFLLVCAARFVLPSVRSPLSSLFRFCWCQAFWRRPSDVAPYLLALCVTFQTEREAIGNDFAVLFVLSNCCHEVHPFFWRIGRNQGLLKGLCAFLCAFRFLEPV